MQGDGGLVFVGGVVDMIGTVCMGDGGRALNVVCTWIGVEHQRFLVFMMTVRFHPLQLERETITTAHGNQRETPIYIIHQNMEREEPDLFNYV